MLKFNIQIRQLSLKFACVAKRVKNVESNSSFFRTNSLFCHSNSSSVIGPLHLGGKFDWKWMTIDEISFCCLVLSYCDRRIWIAVDENGWQARNWMTMFQKLINQRQNWNEQSHIPECPGRNWKHISKIEWRDDENGRETYSSLKFQYSSFNSLQTMQLCSSLFWSSLGTLLYYLWLN